MEKQTKMTTPSSLSNIDQLKISHHIINKCDQTVGSYGLTSSHGIRSKISSKLPSYVFDPQQPNPQDKLMIDKCVQKLKSILTRPQKQSMIRKSQLGQNQLVFSNEQTMKLQIIDQFLQKGYDLPQDPFNIQIYPKINTQQLDIQTSNKQNNQPNPYEAQIENFSNWRKYGNKYNAILITDQLGKKCIQAVNLDNIDQQKSHRKKKQLKLLNFVSHYRQMMNTKKFDKIRVSIENPQLKITKSNKTEKSQRNSNKRSFSDQNLGKQKFGVSKNQSSRLGSTINPSLLNFRMIQRMQQKKQAINKLTDQFYKLKTTSYMTGQRKQALYNCKMIKMTKKYMSHNDYVNLKIITGVCGNLNQKPADSPFYEHEPYTNRNQKQRLINRQSLHIEKVLQKNRNRLKYQKQRVIEKLRC